MEALPLRAGRANCMSNIQQDMIEQTLAILASMMQQAAHDATLYCAEAKRTVIMPRDIELALKRLVLPGSAYWTRDDLSEEAQQIREHLFAADSSDTESDSGDSWVTDVSTRCCRSRTWDHQRCLAAPMAVLRRCSTRVRSGLLVLLCHRA